MPTETQRNFKRQMRELQKETQSENEEFYSYIEKDHIQNYYQDKPKRRSIRTTISIGSIILIIWNVYALSTWLLPQNIKPKLVPAFAINNIKSTNSSQRDIAAYLQSVEEFNIRLNLLFERRNQVFSWGLNAAEKTSNMKAMDEILYEAQSLVNELQKIKPPNIMMQYKELLIYKYSLAYKLFEVSKVAISASDSVIYNSQINKLNMLNLDMSTSNDKVKQEMFRVFDEVGITYEIDGDKIRYKWKN